jgi:hypothetical protein
MQVVYPPQRQILIQLAADQALLRILSHATDIAGKEVRRNTLSFCFSAHTQKVSYLYVSHGLESGRPLKVSTVVRHSHVPVV